MIFILMFLTASSFGALAPRPVPRTVSQIYIGSGVFEGGSPLAAHIEGLRFSRNPQTGTERWVFDFSDARTNSPQLLAPEFQLRLTPPDKVQLADGKEVQISPQRLLISLNAIKNNEIRAKTIQTHLSKSKLVKNIRIYPPIENGDRVIEFTFKHPILLEPHQPLQKEGRLVLDLKPRK